MATPINPKFAKLLDTQKIGKVIEVANKLKANPNWLLAVMFFETGRTFSPSKRNPIGSVGLIQFTRDSAGVNYKTIAGKRYDLDTIGRMSFVQQMDLVYAYYKEALAGRKLNSFIDTYLVTFFPAALGKSDDFVLSTARLSASLIAKQNPAFNLNKDGVIHKGEVVQYFRKIYNDWGFDFDNDINKGAWAIGIVPLLIFFYTCFTITI